jgi:uncharacterized membrane protein YvbJ
MTKCKKCGAQNPGDYKFFVCHKCGHFNEGDMNKIFIDKQSEILKFMGEKE